MREILFKAKRIDNEEWVEGFYGVKGKETEYEKHYIVSNTLDTVTSNRYPFYFTDIEIVPETICQYTGLTDKNGKKIFEGDIIKYHFGEDVALIKFGSYHSCFDSQHTEHCGFYADWKSERNFRKDLGYWVHMVNAEIVGNIHDNNVSNVHISRQGKGQ